MAARQAVNCGPESKVSEASVKEIISAAAPLPPANRNANMEFMDIWEKTVPSEPKRTLVARSLARATEITGHILEAISDEKGVAKKQAAWITNAGRALWGLVEISVPRSLWELLGKYWQSLLLLVAIILLAAGLISGQKGVAGVGWSLAGLAVALFLVRTVLRAWMGGGRNVLGFFRGVIVLLLLALIALGGYRAYQLSTCNLPQWLVEHGCDVITPKCGK
ncbi:MAG TPA: hypothetical protein VFP11_05830, partial [Candidatus Angelobacter sp.]|nr:hypothetical protein [Candidatus Angelobacter sp.]